MSDVVVIYHSGYGHTKKQAEAVAEGAKADLITIDANGDIAEPDWVKLDAAKAIIMGSPTYMGSVSWQFKKFADTSSKRWFTQVWKNKIYAGFTNSASMNGDKFSTIQYLFTLAMQHSGVWVGTGLMPANTKASKHGDVNFLGGFAGALMTSPSDSSPDEVNQGDLETAKLLGIRVAEFAAKA
ncbi:MAG: flavodoxin family protein [Methylotenera sp.]|uniref:flavodoxin family protein n=1 Tax=Methylotenera sp. TaxID=2051956 RepID=UPI0024870EF8|nr:flavodoxin family protein [Methylotenera sp.]MDI1308109.1 flavodoxin family protein [Methylotenera sp.]